MVSVFQRRTTGSVVCPSCGSLVGVRDDKCYSCGRSNPGLWGYGPLVRKIATDFGFVPVVVGGSTIIYALSLLVSGSRKERVVACRALGWIGARRSVPVLIAAIADREWKVRLSAAKSLAALHAPARGAALEALLADRHPRVQKAGRQAQRRLARE